MEVMRRVFQPCRPVPIPCLGDRCELDSSFPEWCICIIFFQKTKAIVCSVSGCCYPCSFFFEKPTMPHLTAKIPHALSLATLLVLGACGGGGGGTGGGGFGFPVGTGDSGTP